MKLSEFKNLRLENIDSQYLPKKGFRAKTTKILNLGATYLVIPTINAVDIKNYRVPGDTLETVIPESISKLRNLNYVNFSSNNIVRLPPSFFSLHLLSEIDLSYNYNFKLGEQINQLAGMRSIKKVHLLGVSEFYRDTIFFINKFKEKGIIVYYSPKQYPLLSK